MVLGDSSWSLSDAWMAATGSPRTTRTPHPWCIRRCQGRRRGCRCRHHHRGNRRLASLEASRLHRRRRVDLSSGLRRVHRHRRHRRSDPCLSTRGECRSRRFRGSRPSPLTPWSKFAASFPMMMSLRGPPLAFSIEVRRRRSDQAQYLALAMPRPRSIIIFALTCE